jgi:hypothetical protein
MIRRPLTWLAGTVAAIAVVSSSSMSVLAEDGKSANVASKAAAPAKKFTTPRTPWGDPDLMGVWDYKTITPLERPQTMAGRALLTDEEVTKLEAAAARNLDQPPDENTPVGTVHAPYMTDRGRKVLDDRRTSLIIDPADGKVPPLTAEAQARAGMRRGGRDGGADGPESRSTAERCITYGFPSATLPTLYNNKSGSFRAPDTWRLPTMIQTRLRSMAVRLPARRFKSGSAIARTPGGRRWWSSPRTSPTPTTGGPTLHTIERHARRQGSRRSPADRR